MLIIDKNKDYYDYLSHVYGIDKKVVFDRRDSSIIDIEHMAGYDCSFFHNRNGAYSFLILEIGFVQYLIKIYNFKYKEDLVIDYSLELIREFRDNKHYYESPLSLRGVRLKHVWNNKGLGLTENTWDNYTEIINRVNEGYDNPILKDTKITSLIDPFTVWKELQTYISSLNNDKNIDIKMNDKEKAETHGFDKNSFRNPIK